MAETSLYWANTTPGDAGPYSNDTFTDTWRKLFLTDRTTQGVIRDYVNELSATSAGGASPVTVATGAGLCDGNFYESTATVDHTISTPAGDTRVDRIVLRKIWADQTVRQYVITGVEGGGLPAITQTDGNTWDVPLWQVSITVGGVITLTDDRTFCQTPLGANPNVLINLLDVDTSVTEVDGDAETTIYTFSVPANTLSTNNILELVLMGQSTGAGQTNVFKVKYGATTLITSGSTDWDTGAFRLVVHLKGDGGTGAQQATMVITNGTNTASDSNVVGDVGTSAEDSTGALNFVVTVDSSAAIGDNLVIETSILKQYVNL